MSPIIKKYSFKNIYTIILCVIIMSFVNYEYTYSAYNYYDYETTNYQNLGEGFNEIYQKFIDNIGISDFLDISAGWCRIRQENENLVIGGSAVVYLGYTMGEKIDDYGYDIIGFGGVCDDKIKDWIPKITKKYKKIILFEGVNTLNIAANNGMKNVTNELFESALTTMAKLTDNVLLENGELIYVKVPKMTYIQDNSDLNHVNIFNELANEYNNTLEAIGIKLYEIPYETTSEYSSGYVHFNNVVVWDHMLKA